MRRPLALVLSWIALCIGLLTVLPRLYPPTWKLQLALTEFSWIGTLAGLFSFRGAKHKHIRMVAFCGTLLSSIPILRFVTTSSKIHTEITSTLGAGYETRIPPLVRERISPSRIWWINVIQLAQRTHFYEEGKVQPDIPYLKTPQRFLKMDIYRPACRPLQGGRYPAVISIHGGSWARGDKGGYFVPHHRYLARQGYVVFDIQYRLTSEADVRWPVPLEDICHAIEWVRSKEHTKMFQVDPDRIALYGRSSGGHLALAAAYKSSPGAIKAVISAYAPTNLQLFGAAESEAVNRLMGGKHTEKPKDYYDASPVWDVRPDSPPTLLLHGGNDALVSPLHSEILYNRLKFMQVPATLLKVPWGRHGFDGLMAGYSAQLTQYYIDRFLAHYLYGEAKE